jgi:hypothetical protein
VIIFTKSSEAAHTLNFRFVMRFSTSCIMYSVGCWTQGRKQGRKQEGGRSGSERGGERYTTRDEPEDQDE